tara:strand:- start:238 stop:618 length:381 start_codon:yes stop_codon:yes gene_type:complete
MIAKEIKLSQKIINNANYKQDFTINIGKENTINSRYIVSCYSLYLGTNPSLDFELLTNVNDICENCNLMFDSVGGWLNKETNLYSLDANMHFNDLNFALKFAKVNKQLAIFDKETKQVIYLNNTKK